MVSVTERMVKIAIHCWAIGLVTFCRGKRLPQHVFRETLTHVLVRQSVCGTLLTKWGRGAPAARMTILLIHSLLSKRMGISILA
jgi:hypothetical protein